MNLHPVIGDTWSKPGSGTYKVTGINGNMVRLACGNSGFAIDVKGYIRMVERDMTKGYTLTRIEETEEFIFE